MDHGTWIPKNSKKKKKSTNSKPKAYADRVRVLQQVFWDLWYLWKFIFRTLDHLEEEWLDVFVLFTQNQRWYFLFTHSHTTHHCSSWPCVCSVDYGGVMLNEPCQSANHRRSAVWDQPRLDPVADDRYSLITSSTVCNTEVQYRALLWSKSMSIFSSGWIFYPIFTLEYLYLYSRINDR